MGGHVASDHRPRHPRPSGRAAWRNESRRPANYGRPRVHPLAGLLRCGSCGRKLITYLQPRQGRGYGCRKDENLVCPGRVGSPLSRWRSMSRGM